MVSQKKIKVLLLCLFVSTFITITLVNDRIQQKVHANTILSVSHTGAPGEPDTCATSGCHSANLNSGKGLLSLSICPLEPFQPGKRYKLIVKQSNPSDSTRQAWGFQLTALDSNNRKAGALSLDQASKTVRLAPGGKLPITSDREYIEHETTDAGTFKGQSSATWEFFWTAPDVSQGPVKFYLAGAQCDGKGDSLGDDIYTTVVTMNPSGKTNPFVFNAVKSGKKKLVVSGSGFTEGAFITINGDKQKTSFSSDQELLVNKLKPAPSQNSIIMAVNPDFSQSNEFFFGAEAFIPPQIDPVPIQSGQTTAIVNYSIPNLNGPCGNTVRCDPPPGSSFALGTTKVACFSDNGPNLTFDITVFNPSVGVCNPGCPSNITVTGSSPQQVPYPAPNPSGTCGTVTCDPKPDFLFPVGTTPVTCTSSSTGAKCMFTVTVVPPTGCSLQCQPNITKSGGPQVVPYLLPVKLGNCGDVICTPPPTATFSLGTTTVTCKETGGTAECMFNITINPPQPCTIDCAGRDLTVTYENRKERYEIPSLSGACGPIVCQPQPGFEFSVGTNQVTCRAAGADDCTFTITVLPPPPPPQPCQFDGQPANIEMDGSGVCKVVTYPLPRIKGDCGSTMPTCTPRPGFCFPVGKSTLVTCTLPDNEPVSFSITINGCPLGIDGSQFDQPVLVDGQIGDIIPVPTTYECPSFLGCNAMCVPSATTVKIGDSVDINVISGTLIICKFKLTVRPRIPVPTIMQERFGIRTTGLKYNFGFRKDTDKYYSEPIDRQHSGSEENIKSPTLLFRSMLSFVWRSQATLGTAAGLFGP